MMYKNKPMKTQIVCLTLFLLHMQICVFSQETKKRTKPNEKIQVKKEFDKDGNLIRYDSIYSYSSHHSQMSSAEIDSIFKKTFPSSGSLLFDAVPADFDGLRFFDGLINMDSIWNQTLERQKLLFDHFFKSVNPKKDSIDLKKQSNR